MPPNSKPEVVGAEEQPTYAKKIANPRKFVIVWRNVAFHIVIHSMAFYGIYASLTTAKLLTSLLGK